MDYKDLREKMVNDQIIARGIKDPRVIEAMRKIPRHEFVPMKSWPNAYCDCPVPIGEGQTISQPYIVALMTQALQLEKSDRALEIGTGCGYQTAILAELCTEVNSIERIAQLSERARRVLDKLNYKNVHLMIGDGTLGWPEAGAFDAILVTAAAPKNMIHLLAQLKDNSRMVIPIGDRYNQSLFCMNKNEGQMNSEEICQCMFVPLIGEYGWRN